MKNYLLLTIFTNLNILAFGQLKVDQNGNIGLGTSYPNPSYKCHIKGNLLLTNYPITPNYALTFKVGNGAPGVEIGSSADAIAFWESNVGYNKLYAEAYYNVSDSSLKTNVLPIVNSLELLKRINSYVYSFNNLKTDTLQNELRVKKYGFISQEIERNLPEVEITKDYQGLKLLDYNQLIPLLTSAVNEQQSIIDSITQTLISLTNKLEQYENDLDLLLSNNSINRNILNQNKPNPFDEETVISFNVVDKNYSSAELLIFDFNGNLIKSYKISSSGKGEILLSKNDISPGIYLYSLIVNNEEVSTKKLILLAKNN